ncbi:MAG TPA: hypothetical protein VNG51_28935 [Ktedonobacteraceae bacterium]|nr:hypothetical protein [Ktedonobacteraceae bacterium]
MTVELSRSADVQTEHATPFMTTQVDDVGNILLEPVPTGTYVMILHLPGRDVVIEDLDIR